MQVLQRCASNISAMSTFGRVLTSNLYSINELKCGLNSLLLHKLNLHTSRSHPMKGGFPEPKGWPKYNEKVFPPQLAEEERRPAVIVYFKLSNAPRGDGVLYRITPVLRREDEHWRYVTLSL